MFYSIANFASVTLKLIFKCLFYKKNGITALKKGQFFRTASAVPYLNAKWTILNPLIIAIQHPIDNTDITLIFCEKSVQRTHFL